MPVLNLHITSLLCLGASIPTSSISMMRPNIEVMCIVKFQYVNVSLTI